MIIPHTFQYTGSHLKYFLIYLLPFFVSEVLNDIPFCWNSDSRLFLMVILGFEHSQGLGAKQRLVWSSLFTSSWISTSQKIFPQWHLCILVEVFSERFKCTLILMTIPRWSLVVRDFPRHGDNPWRIGANKSPTKLQKIHPLSLKPAPLCIIGDPASPP